MRLSIIIISHRPELLQRCLESLLGSGCAGTEVLVLLNGSFPGLREELAGRWPQATVLDIPRSSRGAARNLAVTRASGEILYFLDDDVIAPPGFCRLILEKFYQHPGVGYAGGPNLGTPGATAFQTAVDFALSTAWGAGPMRVRYQDGGRDRLLPSWSFMLCNVGVRRRLFSDAGLAFPESCVSAEENLLLHRAQRLSGPGLFSPELKVQHMRRRDLAGFCHQAFLSGAGRMQITRMAPGSLQPAVLLPSAGLLYLATAARRPALALAPLALYAAGCLLAALHLLFKTRRLTAAAWLPLVLALGHLSYALGMLAGVFLPLDRHSRRAPGLAASGPAPEAPPNP